MQESSMIHIDQYKNWRLTEMVTVLEKLKSEWDKEKLKDHFDNNNDQPPSDDEIENCSLPVKTD